MSQLRNIYKERAGRTLITDLGAMKNRQLQTAVTYLVLGNVGIGAYCLYNALHDHRISATMGRHACANNVWALAAHIQVLDMLYES